MKTKFASTTIVFGFIGKLFRRKRSGWMSLADYRKHYDRALKRNPRRIEREQEQVREWSMRVASEGKKKKET